MAAADRARVAKSNQARRACRRRPPARHPESVARTRRWQGCSTAPGRGACPLRTNVLSASTPAGTQTARVLDRHSVRRIAREEPIGRRARQDDHIELVAQVARADVGVGDARVGELVLFEHPPCPSFVDVFGPRLVERDTCAADRLVFSGSLPSRRPRAVPARARSARRRLGPSGAARPASRARIGTATFASWPVVHAGAAPAATSRLTAIAPPLPRSSISNVGAPSPHTSPADYGGRAPAPSAAARTSARW